MELSYVTAGESHGPGLTVVISGLPAGLELDHGLIRADLARRQAGYGRSPRQRLETDDVRPAIAACQAVVLPSYREGLPRSLLEGAAMGRPLIATDVPGCRDVVDDGSNGLLCAARDPGSLADAMRRFAGMTVEERAAMGAAARAKVQAQFSEQRVIDAYLQALGDVAAPRS